MRDLGSTQRHVRRRRARERGVWAPRARRSPSVRPRSCASRSTTRTTTSSPSRCRASRVARRRCAGSRRRSGGSRSSARRCSSPARPASARSSSRARSTRRGRARRSRSSRSTSRRSRASSSRASSSVTSAARSPAPCRDGVGAFAEADGGTLFLDEIGELPIDVQPKLLRALDGYEVRRVGAAGSGRRGERARRRRDARAAPASTSRAGAFRRDLFHRLAVVRRRAAAAPRAPGRRRCRSRGCSSTQIGGEIGRRELTPAAIAQLDGARLAGQRARAPQRPLSRGGPGARRRAGSTPPSSTARSASAKTAARAHARDARRSASRATAATSAPRRARRESRARRSASCSRDVERAPVDACEDVRDARRLTSSRANAAAWLRARSSDLARSSWRSRCRAAACTCSKSDAPRRAERAERSAVDRRAAPAQATRASSPADSRRSIAAARGERRRCRRRGARRATAKAIRVQRINAEGRDRHRAHRPRRRGVVDRCGAEGRARRATASRSRGEAFARGKLVRQLARPRPRSRARRARPSTSPRRRARRAMRLWFTDGKRVHGRPWAGSPTQARPPARTRTPRSSAARIARSRCSTRTTARRSSSLGGRRRRASELAATPEWRSGARSRSSRSPTSAKTNSASVPSTRSATTSASSASPVSGAMAMREVDGGRARRRFTS